MVMRTYGLSGSGMDVDQLVKDLMKARRATYDKLTKQKTQLEWKKADYNSIYNTVKEFRNSTVFSYRMQSKLAPKKATSSSESVAGATVLADAANIAHSLKVDQLAEGVKKASAGAITPAGNSKATLKSQFSLGDADFTIKLTNGSESKEITVDPDLSINDFVRSVNNSGTGIKASYDANLDRFFFYTGNTGSAASIDFTGSSAEGIAFLKDNLKINTQATFRGSSGSITTGAGTSTLMQQLGLPIDTFQFTINNGAASAVITVDPSQSIDQLVNDINNAGINIQAAYNAETDRFTLSTTNQGADAGITFTGTDATGLAFLNDNLKLNTADYAQNGIDAVFDLDGVQNLAKGSNAFNISGVTYSLKNTGSTTVSVSPDIDATITNVKAFVEEYNKIISKINGELNEKLYRDFLPLTDEQKAEMKDTEIAAWEAKAKSGMLRSDPVLREALMSLRNDMANKIEGLTGEYSSLADLGIKTGDYVDENGKITTEWLEGGKLYVHEDELRLALEEDPDAAYKVFGTDGADNKHDGVAVRLYDTLQTALKKITLRAGTSATFESDTESYLGRMLNTYNKRVNNMEDQLEQLEARYYRQFDAMEAAIERMNKQSAWLSQQFSSGQ